MKILITGANGFLGLNVAKAALHSGHKIFGISQNDSNIKHIKKLIKFKKCTKNNYYNLENDIINFNPDIVLHFAWWGGNSYSDINSIEQFNKNIPLIFSLLDIIKKCPTKTKFIGVG